MTISYEAEADGKPFLLECAVGRGRVLLLTTPVDTDWNSLPLTNFFLPFVQSAVRYAAAGPSALRAARHNLAQGQPIVADFEEAVDARTVGVVVPSGKFDPAELAISQFGNATQEHYTATYAPGIYRVWPHGGGNDPKAILFSVQTPPGESDLAPLSSERWRWLERELGLNLIDPDRHAIAAAQEEGRRGWDLWLPLLGGAVVLSMVELSATRRWLGREA